MAVRPRLRHRSGISGGSLIVAELKVLRPEWHIALRQCFPGSKQTCDLLWGDPPEWAIEIKMFRPNGDNGKPDDRSHRTSAAARNSRAASLSLQRLSWVGGRLGPETLRAPARRTRLRTSAAEADAGHPQSTQQQ